MKEIKCPKCGNVITVDDADFAAVLSQVRTEEFDAEVSRRLEEVHRIHAAEEARKDAETKSRHQQELSDKDQEIVQLKQRLEGWEQNKGLEIEALRLKAQQDVAAAVSKKEEELRQKEAKITSLLTEAANERRSAADREQALKDKYQAEKEGLEKEVEWYKNFKAKRNVKLLGEDLEQHCYALYNQLLLPVMPNATFEKDNDAVREDGETRGTKGDFIFRAKEDDVEYISIMFEMKNEGDETSTKHKNADFFDKLDKDRQKKGCEFAVLVTMLEPDNDLYNNGIVVAPGYEKMYVVRPDNFIPIITLLVQTSKKSLEAKKALVEARSQAYDVTHFEEQLLAFRDGFAKTVTNAKNRYDEAIRGIDDTIKTLTGIKESLRVSAGHLTAANNKVEDLSIKKLTRGNPTMKTAFEEARAKKALEGPEDQ